MAPTNIIIWLISYRIRAELKFKLQRLTIICVSVNHKAPRRMLYIDSSVRGAMCDMMMIKDVFQIYVFFSSLSAVTRNHSLRKIKNPLNWHNQYHGIVVINLWFTMLLNFSLGVILLFQTIKIYDIPLPSATRCIQCYTRIEYCSMIRFMSYLYDKCENASNWYVTYLTLFAYLLLSQSHVHHEQYFQ